MSAYSSHGASKVKAAAKLAEADKEVGYISGGSRPPPPSLVETMSRLSEETLRNPAVDEGHEDRGKLPPEKSAAALDNQGAQHDLCNAIFEGNEAMVKLLLENGAAADSKDRLDRTSLSYVTERGNEAIVKLLLEYGAAAESKDRLDRTPLSYAAERGNEATVKLLLRNGAAADSKDNFGRTSLSYAAEGGNEAIVKLLLSKGAAVDSKDRLGWTSLTYAAVGGKEAMVRLLLESGAAAHSKDHSIQTPFSLADARGDEAVVKLLRENSAAADSRHIFGQTPLSHAAAKGNEAVVELLLEAEDATADPEERWGQTMNLPLPDREEIIRRTNHRNTFKSVDDRIFLTNDKMVKQEYTANQAIDALNTSKERYQTTRPTSFSSVDEKKESTFNHPIETARQEVMHSNEHLSSSSEDDTEEWQYEDKPDTFSASQSSNELDNVNPSFPAPQLVEDIDIMNPDAWIYRMKNAESEAFKKSYILHSAAQRRDDQIYLNARLLLPVAGSVKFDTILLPEDCPIAHLNDIWSQLVQQSERLNNHISNNAGSEIARISAYAQQYVGKLILSRNVIINLCKQVETLNQAIDLPIPGFNFFVSKRRHVLENVAVQLCQLTTFIQHIHNLLSHCLDEAIGIHRGLRCDNPSLDPIPFNIDGAGNFATSNGSDDHPLEASNILEVTRRWFCIAQILDIGLVSYTSAHLEDGEGHAAYLSQQDYALNLVIGKGRFSPIALECMQSLLKGSKVWVYSSHNIKDIQPAWISIHENVLDNIWGPMWKLTPKDGTKTGHYYALGSGAIGVAANSVHLLDGMNVEQDEVMCHFEPSIDFIEHSLLPIEDLDHGRLLIGAAGLNINTGCNGLSQAEGLRGLSIRPHGTSKDRSYQNSSTYSITAGWSGSSISYQRQYLRRQGTTRKEGIINRWKFKPDAQNPCQLLLRCGLEVSLCTRNARRRQFLQLMGSPSLLKSLQNFPWKDARCGNEVQNAFRNRDSEDFVHLYNNQEWRKDIGEAVSWMFELLADTGVQADGDLAAFTSLEASSVDPERITVFRAHQHTWIGLLKDSIHTATFAIIATECLEFPYPHVPGQRCRFESTTPIQNSVLETMIAPILDTNDSQSSKWIRNYHTDDYLRLDSSRKEMLKLLTHLPDKSAAFRWSDTAYLQAAALRLIGDKRCADFQEYSGDGTQESRMARTAFIVSKRHEDLPTPRRRKRKISSLARTQEEVMEDVDNRDVQSTADVQKAGLMHQFRSSETVYPRTSQPSYDSVTGNLAYARLMA